MRITHYTDYTLRVLIYLAMRYESGIRSTIPEIAKAYGLSTNHLRKIMSDLSQHRLVDTSRGRDGGAVLAMAPSLISIGAVVRITEPDFSLVECHVQGTMSTCVVASTCNLNHRFRRALEAFLAELDGMTLEDAVASKADAAAMLMIDPPHRGNSVVVRLIKHQDT